MSSMACATHLFALFSRVRSSVQPEYGLVPVNVLQNCPEADPPQCATVSKALLSRLHRLPVEMGGIKVFFINGDEKEPNSNFGE
jgi:hypothetical protein